MTLQSAYLKIGANFEEVMGRLMTEERILKFLKKYVDANECADLERALQDKDYQKAFMHAHNIKGFGLNMSLTNLQNSASILSEILRHGEPTVDPTAALAKVQKANKEVVDMVASVG